MQYLILLLSAIILFLTASISEVFAIETPNFPSCSNPQGTIKSDYPAGTHGIAGDSRQFSGSDKVYSLSDNTLQQCFCSINGDGIQTNWWKIESLTEDQIEILKRDGWVFIPNGSLWGLEEASYLAKNSNYSCGGGGNNSGSSNSDSSGSTGGGEVLGASISLPKTGADARWLIIASVSLISGLVILFKGLRSKKSP